MRETRAVPVLVGILHPCRIGAHILTDAGRDDMHVGGTMQALLGETISTDVGELWFDQEQS